MYVYFSYILRSFYKPIDVRVRLRKVYDSILNEMLE